ncbi:PHP domain-containing protein [Anaerobacterium chartisolvens]|uniref:PHP domain-containing protein n=1 Tax=Anaerobacterium chartisolvens TaxID=1297424 RepID=UPI000DF11166|nr:PHP domain-containing protein [Anaerobacterium chartisolvens]
MDKYIDLHTHSTASDGSMSPGELVRHAAKCGLHAVAITDHDTVEGVDEAADEGRKLGIEVIAGVEISANYKPEMHILGYFFNGAHDNIKPALSRLRENRDVRNPKIIKRLNELGFNISLEEVEAEVMGSVVGRPHIAKAMLKKGYVKSIEEAFDKYLSTGRPAYFKKDKLTPEEGIKEILRAGGIPVVAHPIYLYHTWSELDKLFGNLVKSGLKGIEAYYVDNSADDTGNLLRLAIKHGLLVTGGSDFHGSFKNGIEIGVGRGNLKIEYVLLEKLKKAANV